MNQAIQEEIDKGGPPEQRGAEPLDIRPPTVEERIRARQRREEAQREETPVAETVPAQAAAEKPAARELAAEAKEAVLARRRQELESSFTALQERIKSGEDVPVDTKKDLMERMLRDVVAEMRPALEVSLSKLGREVASPGQADKYEAGLKHVIDFYLANNLSSVTHFDNLLKMQPDAKLVREKIQDRFVSFLTREETNPFKSSDQRQEQLKPKRPAPPPAQPKNVKSTAVSDAVREIKKEFEYRDRLRAARQQNLDRQKKAGSDDIAAAA